MTSTAFDTRLGALEKSVDAHAENEEREEFRVILERCSEQHRQGLRERIKSVESIAATHRHPTTSGKPAALAAVGPFASIVDRVKEALSDAGK